MARTWTAEDDTELVRLASAGVSRTVIAKHLDRSLVAVEHRASRLRVSLAIDAIAGLIPTTTQRSVLQRLRTDQWLSFAGLNIAAGAGLLKRLVSNGWMESRGQGRAFEVKLTAAGLDALKAKIPDYRRTAVAESE
jgi:hypothetical protein